MTRLREREKEKREKKEKKKSNQKKKKKEKIKRKRERELPPYPPKGGRRNKFRPELTRARVYVSNHFRDVTKKVRANVCVK